MDTNKFWLFCPTCGEKIPEIYFSSNKNVDLIDIRCSCEIEQKNIYYDNITTLNPQTYVNYCKDATKGEDQNGIDLNSKGKEFCLHCKKWLTQFEIDLHNKITFSYPHIFTTCDINIGSFCEESQEHHPTLNIPSKFFCETHGKHICEQCNNQYHLPKGFCVVHSLETMRQKVNKLYMKLSKMKRKTDNNTQKEQNNPHNKQHAKYQKDIELFFTQEFMKNLFQNKQSIKELLSNLFRLYFGISKGHYPNYRLAKSILNLNMTLENKKNDCYQINLNNKSINYSQIMNFYPKQLFKNLSEIKDFHNSDVPFSSPLIPLDLEHDGQFVFMSENTFKIGGIVPIDEPNQERPTQNSSKKLTSILKYSNILNIPLPFTLESHSPKTQNNSTLQPNLNNSLVYNSKNIIRSGCSSSINIDFNQEQIKSPKIEQEGFTPKDDRSTNCEQEEDSGVFSNKDKTNNKKLIFEINYKPIAKTIRLIKFIKCQFDNRLAAFCRQKEGMKEHFYIKIFEPIINERNGRIIGYKTNDKKDFFSKQLKSDFSDFTGFCDYTLYSKSNNNAQKKENEWKFLCFGNQLLKITFEEGKKIQTETKLKFKDVNFKNFSHFIIVPHEQDEESLCNHFSSLMSLMSNFFHLIVENLVPSSAKGTSKFHSIVHSLILKNQEKPILKKLFESQSPQIQSICHLHTNIIAVGGITNQIEIFSFEKEGEDNVKLGKTIEVLKTQHNNGIHCIIVFEKWFISGGGNGTFIIWNIDSLRMLNVISDDKAAPFPLISIIQYNCPLGENTLCCCYKAR